MAIKNKIAGAIFAFNRPHYLEQVLNSLEDCEGIDKIDWFAYQDGAVNRVSKLRHAEDKDIDESFDLLVRSSLDFEIRVNPDNQCIARQKHKAHQLFKDYDMVFFFEDDMIVSPYYLRLLELALTKYPNYGILLNRTTNKGNRLNALELCPIARIWGYGMTKQLYDRIEPKWNEWHDKMQHIDYLIRRQYKQRDVQIPFRTRTHDIFITRLCREFGGGKLWPHVSRGIGIGEIGSIAFRKREKWLKKGLDLQPKKYIYDEDEILKGFKLK